MMTIDLNLIFGIHGKSSIQIFMNRVLILGKDGMLGTMVSSYLTSLKDYEIYLTSRRDEDIDLDDKTFENLMYQLIV